jgi:hypothetical protein
VLKISLIITLAILLLPLLSSCVLDKRPQPYALESPIKSLLGLLAIFAILVVALVLYLSPPPANRGQSTYSRYAPPQNSAAFHIPSAPAYQQGGTAYSSPMILEVLYHGTPKLANAVDITEPNSGFIIGNGNACGTGFYLGDFETAKGYAKGAGAILKIKLEAPADQVADLKSVQKSAEFKNWCFVHGSKNFGDDLSRYVITVLKKRFIKVGNQKLYVALADRTSKNQRVVFEGLTILGVLDAQGNPL